MKIAIIGAGFTGLSSANILSQKKHEIKVFEKDEHPGGLALGYKEKLWEWSLEKHYHHWFTNDHEILSLAKEINYPVITKRPKTSIFVKDKIYQLDSPLNVLIFPLLSIFERARMAAVLGFLRYNPFWKSLERITAEDFLHKAMGQKAYDSIWKPQLVNKFGNYAGLTSLAWFWARIKKRTPSLVYPAGGFLEFAQSLQKQIESQGAKFYFHTSVNEIKTDNKGKIRLENEDFDKVIVTLPSFMFLKIAPQLPPDYKKKLSALKSLGAVNLIMRLKKPFLKDKTYWLSICDLNSPIMAIVEHTNFMDKKYYNNEHIVYLGNYLPYDHPYMKTSAEELLKIYDPFLRKINPNYKLSIINCKLFTAPFAQPVIPVNYSKIMPPLETPLKNVYLANIQQVYPWDRGTNYAVELGEKIAKLIG